MTKPEDLTGDNKILFKAWTSLGMSEESAMRSLRDSGWLPMSDQDQLARSFMSTFGLSEQAAEIAAGGRDGSSVRPVSETSAQSPAAAIAAQVEENGRRLIAVIESWAEDIRRGGPGGMVVYKGESREAASIRRAFGKVFLAIPDTEIATTGSWVLSVAEARWPWLRKMPAQSSGKPARQPSARRSGTGKKLSETTPQPYRFVANGD